MTITLNYNWDKARLLQEYKDQAIAFRTEAAIATAKAEALDTVVATLAVYIIETP